MEYIGHLIDFILHIDKHLDVITTNYGGWTYVILVLIVFCETGLVIFPLLPGDSLLFAAGAIAARGNLSTPILMLSLSLAAIIGDAVNYHIGKFLGPEVLKSKRMRFIKPEYIERTQRFYDKYGGKTIIFARFVPIVRTFAPFLAGVGTMTYARFALFNVVGGIVWVVCFVGAGALFGDLPIVKKNFTLVILAIIVLSIMPGVIEYYKARKELREKSATA